MGITVAPDGARVYVGVFLPDRSGRLEVIDAAKRAVIASVPIGVRPSRSRQPRWSYGLHDRP
jgi:YVTN family beta-propeller protein